ncbi:helix-turn-helix domain-containing protein [Streptomyces sp. NBC_00111]|uniref:PucR family transcriptional regulator n=1 Tax=unclassified Streptomyces TaxID=2593676 RepID=UPI002E32B0A6|nr:helix-turn-helix domain-containing protein [Streptomyces sp. NBC_01460]
MEHETPTAWPVLRRMPDLATLDEPTRTGVVAAVTRLRSLGDVFADRYLTLVRTHVPAYAVLSDDEVRSSARRFMDILVSELSSLRVPDAALRDMLGEYAVERAARGLPLDALAIGYQLGSREMLALVDEVAAEVGLSPDFLLAVHDSTWEFANEASSVFARVQHDLALERAHFDAERRSAYAGGVLSGTLPAERINSDAPLFGLAPQTDYVALAARAASADDADAVRRAIASAVRVPADRLLLAQVGAVLGFIAPRAPEAVACHLVAAGPPLPLDQLATGFDDAVLALETARRFAMSGVVRLSDLGPRPLVLSDARIAEGLATRHLAALDAAGRSSGEIEETARAYLDCDQDVREVARRLAVHPNTVRYRVNRFQQLTGLDLRRTEDLVTSWWLLNRRGT